MRTQTSIRKKLFIFGFVIVVSLIMFCQKQLSHVPTSKALQKKRYVFFDLGVNNGDSLTQFFEIKTNGKLSINFII